MAKRMKVISCICRECGIHFKMTRGDRRWPGIRRDRKLTGKMPVTYCLNCIDKMKIRLNDHFRTGSQRCAIYLPNSGTPKNFHRRARERPWAWRELDV